MEIAITVAMCTHVYTFAGKFDLQRDGGPIGLRSTPALASLIMKLWDMAWVKLLEKENFVFDLYFRYVDDNRLFARPLLEGWYREEKSFKFSNEKLILDMESGESDQQRTTREIVKAMSSLVNFLEFEGEESSMF